jgi:dTDP-L-rhamnose 4-epimerase
VRILDNLEPDTHPQGKPSWINAKAHFIQGDIREESILFRALDGVHWIFHLAAFGGFTIETSKYVDVNVKGTARIFESILRRKYDVEKIVIASSQGVYGEGAYRCRKDGPVITGPRSLEQLRKKQWDPSCPRCGNRLEPVPTAEEKPKECETPYTLSKEFSERLALAQGRQMGIPVVALRYGVTYGPRQSIFNPYTGVVSIFSTRILNDLPPLVYEDGEQTRDFVYVGDVAQATLFVMENELANFEVFNVGTGKATSVAHLARTLASIYGKKIGPETPGEFRCGDVRHIILDSGKLSRMGFQAQTSLEEGLSSFAKWIRGQGNVKQYFTEAYERLKKHRLIQT